MEREVGRGVVFIKHIDNVTPIPHILNRANVKGCCWSAH